MLMAFRFLTGFFGSPALATGGATIADMYRPQKQAYGLAVWGIGAVCGPVLGKNTVFELHTRHTLTSCFQPCRSVDRWLRCHGKGLDMDNLGAHVALRLLLGLLVLPPPGDKFAEHPASQDKEIEEDHR